MQPVPATFTFPGGGYTGGNLVKNSRAYNDIKQKNVTFFGSPLMAFFGFLGSVIVSVLQIGIDSVSIAITVGGNSTLSTHPSHQQSKDRLIVLWSFLLICDVLTLTTQAIDIWSFNFRCWPLTSFTWTTQLTGTSLSAALIGILFFETGFDDMSMLMFVYALVSLVLHTSFTASQFAVTLEKFTRATTTTTVAVAADEP